jgi:sarcosine oxidase subunit alpha
MILATGSTDRPHPFPGGSLPGVLSGRAVQLLLHVHRVWPGRRFVVVGEGAEAAEVAEDIRVAGGEVVAEVGAGAVVSAAGAEGVEAVVVDGARVAADVVAVAVGRQPDAMLAQMAGCALIPSAEAGGYVPVRDERLRTTVPGVIVAGDAGGVGDVATVMAEGRLAGLAAAGELGLVAERMVMEAADRFGREFPGRIGAVPGGRPAHVQAYR